MESYREEDLATLRAMARSAGIAGADEMEHDQLVDALRDSGLATPPAAAGSAAAPARTMSGSDVYHGEGAGQRDTTGSAG